MKNVDDLERIPLSSLKQFVYCQRRFALMYIENEWGSNYKIVEGDLLHEKVDDPFFNEKRGDVHISRSVPIYSDLLNLYGVADIVEFIKDQEGVKVSGKRGLWRISPLEYKNGKPEGSGADNYQLCAQALCLEEMFETKIYSGNIYYGKLKRRVNVELTQSMKDSVKLHVNKMIELLLSQTIPDKTEDQNCNLCSLINVCMPDVIDKPKMVKDRIAKLMRG
ncbi:MAG: CRISPR-associated protein Cas4 [Alkaliphilus sp.]